MSFDDAHSDLDRRDFARSSLAWLGGLSIPSHWLQDLVQPQQDEVVREIDDALFPRLDPNVARVSRFERLQRAAALAAAQGKELLVVVIPQDRDVRFDWGRWVGIWLTYGGEEVQLDVACCVPACASSAELGKLVGRADLPDAPAFAVVDPRLEPTSGAPSMRFARTNCSCPPLTRGMRLMLLEESERNELEDRELRTGCESLSRALRTALDAQGESVSTAAARLRLAPEDRRRVETWFAGGAIPPPELLVHACAWIRSHVAALDAEARTRLLAVLGAAVRRELLQKRVPGSAWIQNRGCGTTLEAPEEGEIVGMVACGMGCVPERAERFLYFFADPPK